MLKSWDALHQKERDEKCCFLQKKVKLQHDLIAKADQLSGEIRAKAMEEQQEVSGHLEKIWPTCQIITTFTYYV